MNLINKEFTEIGTGNTFKIIDVYQHIAITNERERVDVKRLMDTKYYIPSGHPIQQVNEKKFEIVMEDDIDPNTFLNNDRTYNLFAEAIKSIPEDRLPKDDGEIQISGTQVPMPTDSAIIVDNNYDEKEELMRKYGINNQNVDLQSHNQKFEKFMSDEVVEISVDRDENREIPMPTPQQIERPRKVENQVKEDPIITMFKNVKKSVDLKVSFEIENKIPRIDFIEMMEDSYETSIIEFFANEFTDQIIRNPEIIKKKIVDEIKRVVYGEEKKSTPSNPIKKVSPKKQTKRASENPITEVKPKRSPRKKKIENVDDK